MSYPINDIFEGTADLLLEHGTDVELWLDKGDTNKMFYHINYGYFHYLVVYKDGKLQSITRCEKEDDNGQD